MGKMQHQRDTLAYFDMSIAYALCLESDTTALSLS